MPRPAPAVIEVHGGAGGTTIGPSLAYTQLDTAWDGEPAISAALQHYVDRTFGERIEPIDKSTRRRFTCWSDDFNSSRGRRVRPSDRIVAARQGPGRRYNLSRGVTGIVGLARCSTRPAGREHREKIAPSCTRVS